MAITRLEEAQHANEKSKALKKIEERKRQQARKKKEKTLGQKQFETYMAEKDTGFKKAQRIQKTYEGASPEIKADLEKRFKNVFNPKEMVVSSRRDTAKVQNMAKGGRAGFKSGSKGCKLAMKGKGRAYGKNS